MLSTPTLRMARKYFTDHLSKLDDSILYASDRIVYRVAVDCIDYCIESNFREAALKQANAEVDQALRLLFERSETNAQNKSEQAAT